MPSNLIHQTILGRYRVDEFIAAGGMGAVYRVYDLQRNAALAMKILHDDLADDPAFVRRFQKEAGNLALLTHPNIVPFFGLEQTPDFVFLLQDFIDGCSLKEILARRKGRPFSIPESLVWIKALQAALGYAHVNQVIHCDLKPGNVMVSQGGRIYLTDFGIARQMGGGSVTLAYAGSPGYMAPEQIRGEEPTPATDIYALGGLLFELLTGRRVFQGDEPGSQAGGDTSSQRILYAHLHLQPPDARQFNPALPQAFSAALARALEKEPGKRYPNVQAFYAALLQAMGMETSQVADRWLIQGKPGDAATTILEPLPPAAPAPAEKDIGKPKPRAGGRRSGVILAVGIIAVVGMLLVGWLWRSLSQGDKNGDESSRQPDLAASEVGGLPGAGQTLEPANSVEIQIEATTLSETVPESPQPTAASPELLASATPLPASKTPKAAAADPRKMPLVYEPLLNCASSRVKIGTWAFVTFGGGKNAIRSNADLHADDNWVGVAEEGEPLLVVGGPECNLGWIMWEVKKDRSVSGWTPENDGKKFFLEPFPTWSACSDAPPSTLLKGELAMVAPVPDSANRLREKPDIGSAKIGDIAPREVVKILGGPRCAGGYTWWRVQSLDGGKEGWTAEGRAGEAWLIPYKLDKK